MADFSNIKVGDKIKYYPLFGGNFPHVATVTKVTPKQFEDSKKVRFRKSDGWCISGCYIDCSIATEEDIAEFNRLKLRKNTNGCKRTFGHGQF